MCVCMGGGGGGRYLLIHKLIGCFPVHAHISFPLFMKFAGPPKGEGTG